MKKVAFTIILSCFLFIIISCAGEYTPKPAGYARIERSNVELRKNDFGDFSFLYPSDVYIEEAQNDQYDGVWFNLVYPEYNSVIYCTYLPISKNKFPEKVDENYRIVYNHALKSESITQKVYLDSLNNAYGVVYNIKGAVATPIQFYVSDSISHFLRGSLYFNDEVSPDSVKQIVDIIEKDVVHLVESVRWKDNQIIE